MDCSASGAKILLLTPFGASLHDNRIARETTILNRLREDLFGIFTKVKKTFPASARRFASLRKAVKKTTKLEILEFKRENDPPLRRINLSKASISQTMFA